MFEGYSLGLIVFLIMVNFFGVNKECEKRVFYKLWDVILIEEKKKFVVMVNIYFIWRKFYKF